MAYDTTLADRIRAVLGGEAHVTERRMFGGLAFLVGGNMAVAANSQGGIMVRLDPSDADAAVASGSARFMQMRGRPMRGWICLDSADVSTKRDLSTWVARGTAYARTLPLKQ